MSIPGGMLFHTQGCQSLRNAPGVHPGDFLEEDIYANKDKQDSKRP